MQEIQRVPYPLFPDLRGDQLSSDSVITAGMDQLTVNWISPVSVDKSSRQYTQADRAAKKFAQQLDLTR